MSTNNEKKDAADIFDDLSDLSDLLDLGSTAATVSAGRVTATAPVARRGRSVCNQQTAMLILGLSHAKFKKLGLVPTEIIRNPNGYGGKEYLYSMEQVQALAGCSAEVERRLGRFRGRS